MTESDFAELAAAGVTLLGEVGLGSVKAGRGGAADGGVGAQARHPEHHPHRRAVDPRLGADRQGRGAGSRRRRHRPHQRRSHRAARSARVRAVRALHPRDRDRAQRQREGRGRGGAGGARRQVPAPGDPGNRRAGRLGRAAARHSAGDRPAVQPGRHPGGAGVLLRHRQHRPHPQARLRADRAGPRRRLRVPGSGSAHRRENAAGKRGARRHSGRGHGGDRRRRALRAQPQYAAGDRGSGGCRRPPH